MYQNIDTAYSLFFFIYKQQIILCYLQQQRYSIPC